MNTHDVKEICISKCTVKVLRHGGWRLGVSKRQLIEAIVLLLENLLALRAKQTDADIVIQQPIKLRLKLDRFELKSLVAIGGNSGELQRLLFSQEGLSAMLHAQASQLEQQIDQAVDSASKSIVLRESSTRTKVWDSWTFDSSAPSILRCLQSTRTLQNVSRLVSSMSWDELCRWFYSLVNELAGDEALIVRSDDRARRSSQGVHTAAAQEAIRWMSEEIGVTADATSHELLCSCICAVVIACDLPEKQKYVRHLLAKGHAVIEGANFGSTKSQEGTVGSKEIILSRKADRSQINRSSGRNLPTDIRISTALPFLMLRPLNELGVLPWIASTFSVYEREDLLPALAASLAWKCMSIPQRGWLRTPIDEETVSAFAGCLELDPNSVDQLESDSERLLMPATRHLSNLISESGVRRMVTSPELGSDCFPWVIDEHQRYPLPWLLPSSVEPSLLLVAANAASPGFLSMLSSNSIRFLIPVPPVAGEELVRYSVAGRYWWSNIADLEELEIRRTTQCYESLTVLAGEIWNEMGAARPAIAYKQSTRFEQILATIVSAAFGEIANSLWSHREKAFPVLMLERFSDFDGTVRFEEDRIVVRLPWGQRYDDLESHGWLRDVKNVPWYGGRHVTFCRG